MFNKTLNTIVKAGLILGMLGGIALLVFIILESANMAQNGYMETHGALLVAGGMIATLCVAGGEFIAVTLFKMMCSLNADPFVAGNVTALKRMGVAALIIMALGLSTLILQPVPLAVVAALPIGMCGLFSLVLSQVFQKAVEYKEENDMTV